MTPLLILGGVAVLAIAMSSSNKSSNAGWGDPGQSAPPGDPMPKAVDGVPFAPAPPGALYWPVHFADPSYSPRVSYRAADNQIIGIAGNRFGADRGTRVHAGIDLYGRKGDNVIAIADGTVVGKQGWSGNNAKALVVDHGFAVVVYGALWPGVSETLGIDIGTAVRAGDKIGEIGVYPGGSQMLHFETYTHGTKKNFRWMKGQKPPSNLLNPSLLLLWLRFRSGRSPHKGTV